MRLNAALASVIGVVDSADARPTVQARALAEEYMAGIDAELERLDVLLMRRKARRQIHGKPTDVAPDRVSSSHPRARWWWWASRFTA